jgi:uncharacterized metal-binding protein YceD (DUF177 family)
MQKHPRPVEPWSHILRLDDGSRAGHTFELVPPAEVRAALAERLGILALRKLRFAGRLEPQRKRDWRLVGELGATAVQACVVTLAPVTTRIDETMERRYLAQMPDLPDGDEIEMPDDTVEPLPAALDVGAVMAEALALALPAWPRAEGVEYGQGAYAEPGTQPLTDADARPFAGLKGLIRKRHDDT